MLKKDVEAYILIVVQHGAEHKVLEDLMKIDGVKEASLVYGEFDIHVKIVVEDMDEFREVHDKIRQLRILTTDTLIAYERGPTRKASVRDYHVRKLGHKRARHH